MTALTSFLDKGGLAIWVIAVLSVLTLAVILWKIWSLSINGAWRGARAEVAVTMWEVGQTEAAMAEVAIRGGLRARLVREAMATLKRGLPADLAREEVTRHAKALLTDARSGLRLLELVTTIAPLIGLLGTVLGMIEAFQALQDTGAQADPAALAGGIWEALLTTAAGMGVAIPAAIALSWFESVVDTMRHDMEALATRLFVAGGANV